MGIYKRCCSLLFLPAIPGGFCCWHKRPGMQGSLHGQVTDPSGAVVIGAAVSVTAPDGQMQKTVSDKQGNYYIHGLPEGNVTVSAAAAGFSPYQMPNVIITAGQAQQLDITSASPS